MTTFLAIIIFFVYNSEVSSITQFNTHEGCNASFACYHPFGASVSWNSSRGPLQQGPKLVIQNTSYYSVLSLISVSPADNGNITCERNQSETLYFSLTVQAPVECKDIYNTVTCKGAVDGGDDCTHIWMKNNCKKSCGLCPIVKYNCTETNEPTDPPTLPSTTRHSSDFSTTSILNKTKANNNTATSPPPSNILYLGIFLIMLHLEIW